MTETALVVGYGRSGEAAARHLRARGATVVVVDDKASDELAAKAAERRLRLVTAPTPEVLESLVARADVVVPSPGIPLRHPIFKLAEAHHVPVRSEVELAYRWARRPMVAITGTNGKTTVTALVAEMLVESGVAALAAGNIGLPLSDAVRRDVRVLVVEVSSFQLHFTETFRPAVAVWLNVAEDHLDWHDDLEAYVAAKARIWQNQHRGDTAIVNADDPAVMAAAAHAPSRIVTFGLQNRAQYHVSGGVLRSPAGDILAAADLPRALPHDQANALAATAAALAAGATMDGVRTALRGFRGLRHRLALVAERDGIRWYNDSKATNPHAATAAVRSFSSVVLIAGGRNKGLDLGELAGIASRLRGVVAMGEAAAEVEAVFAGLCPVVSVGSMQAAVRAAAELARPGDAVVLSPACASFDAYANYEERGHDFERTVQSLLATGSASLASGDPQ